MAIKIKVGDTVLCKTGFGQGPTKRLVVESIQINCKNKDGKYVNEVEVPKGGLDRSVIMDLSEDTWAYGYQIKPTNN